MTLHCSVFIATSLDGYIARANGGLDWLERVQLPGEDYGFGAFFAGIDALVIGRSTYTTALGFSTWPYEGKRVYVVTHRPIAASHDEQFVSGTPLEIAERVSRDGCVHAYVDGGAVIRQFAAANLISRWTISVVPILLGEGIRLFLSSPTEHPLVLESSRSWPATGLVQSTYAASK